MYESQVYKCDTCEDKCVIWKLPNNDEYPCPDCRPTQYKRVLDNIIPTYTGIVEQGAELRAIKKLISHEIRVLQYYADNVLQFPHNLNLCAIIQTLKKTQGLHKINGLEESMSLKEYHEFINSINTVNFQPNTFEEY